LLQTIKESTLMPILKNINFKLLLVLTLFHNLFSFGQAKKWTLEECVSYAITHNISIKQSALDKELSDISKKDAIGRFLPTANAQASHSWNIGLNQNITTGLLENQTTQFTSAGINVGIDIYKGLQHQNQLRKANLSKIAAQYQVTKMQEDVSLNVVNGYLQILFNKENLKVQTQQLSFDGKQLARTTDLVEAGSIPRGDLLDVKATIAADNQRLIAAENALFLSKLSLAQLLQLDNFQDFDIVDADSLVVDSAILMQDPKAILDKAKQTRTDLKIAQTNVQIAEKDIQIAKGAYEPSVQGFYGFNSRVSYADRIIGVDSSGKPLFSAPLPFFNQFSDNKGQSFGVNLNIPILNGFSVRNNVARSKISLERSKNILQQQELDLERIVFTAYTDTKGAQKTNEAAISSLEAREKAFNYAKERYEVGLMNVFDFNQAQTLFVNAQSEVLRTKYDYIFRTKILEFYFGIPFIKKS
jgi:outer membrane protein